MMQQKVVKATNLSNEKGILSNNSPYEQRYEATNSITDVSPNRGQLEFLNNIQVQKPSSHVADDSVIALANTCPHMRFLRLYYCKNIKHRNVLRINLFLSKHRREAIENNVVEMEDADWFNELRGVLLVVGRENKELVKVEGTHTLQNRYELWLFRHSFGQT